MRKDLPASQRIVQACHAAIEASRQFLTPAHEHPHLVLCGVKDEAELERECQRLTALGIRFAQFHEPDRGNELTAIASEPLSGEARRPMRRYKLLSEDSEDAESNRKTWARGPPVE